jgi:hypothetical protein
MKTILLSVLFLVAIDIGFALGFWWGLVALGASYWVAKIVEKGN